MTAPQFDYVIVGGGSAGAVLANRLSANPLVRVCLLEAGGDGRDLLIRAPMAAAIMLPGKPIKVNNWAFETLPQPGLKGRRGYQPRGKALGGSSAINAMLYVRGQREDYDQWRDMGCEGWGFDDVLAYFKRSENNQRGNSELHGTGGPLSVAFQQSPRAISKAWIEAAQQCGLALNGDFNGPSQEGVGLHQVTQFWDDQRNGERCSSAAGYLHPIMTQRPNLTVITGAHATELLWKDRRISGVKYRRGQQFLEVHAQAEVLLCTGAFQSPQLLMLSGIGPAEHLQSLGIEVKQDLPGVGANLQDHLDVTLAYHSLRNDVIGVAPVAAWQLLKGIQQWRKDGTGMVATPYAEAGAFVRCAPDAQRPDIQFHFVVARVEDHARRLHWGYGYSCHVCVLRPHSRGSVRLQSHDPLDAPLIDPAYLSDHRDTALMVEGVKKLRTIMQAPALQSYRGKEIYTAGIETDAQWEGYIRERADTIYHSVGTCKMGAAHDPMAVLDTQLRVKGVLGLRVIDASAMPTLISGNTNAPTIMMAEKAADFLLP
ncbi:MAG: glucose-methanol-choline oxidoreductase [Betaproteobacteria bacterium]|nr:glucose-methanol-choline oxidoreductase [Betaproteobacteria bacterium]